MPQSGEMVTGLPKEKLFEKRITGKNEKYGNTNSKKQPV